MSIYEINDSFRIPQFFFVLYKPHSIWEQIKYTIVVGIYSKDHYRIIELKENEVGSSGR